MTSWLNPNEGSMYRAGPLGEVVARTFTDYAAWMQQSGRVVNLNRWSQSVGASGGSAAASWTAFGTSAVANFTFTKENAATKLELSGSTSGTRATANGLVLVGVSETHAGNVQLGQYTFNALNDHRTIGMMGEIAGGVVPAGTVTLSAVYETDGAGAFNFDTHDQWQLLVAEVWP